MLGLTYAQSTKAKSEMINSVVDISNYIDSKVRANMCNVTQGPGENKGTDLRKRD